MTNSASKAERYVLERWYDSFDTHSEQIQGADEQKSRTAFEDRIIERAVGLQHVIPSKLGRRTWVKLAAACLLVSVSLGLGTYLWQQRAGGNPNLSEDKWATYVTATGKIKKITLPDGSNIWLNSGSTLEVQLPFTQTGERRVRLIEGEAFFDVEPDTQKSFIVNTADLYTRVLGTSFNIRAYRTTGKLDISVESGRVSVSKRNHVNQVLAAGEKLSYDNAQGSYTVIKEKFTRNNSWLTGRTELWQVSFEELALAVSNTYGIEIRAASPRISHQQYSIQLDARLPIDDVLHTICKINGNNYRKEGDIVMIY